MVRLPRYFEWFALALFPPALRSLPAAAAMLSLFFSAPVWFAFGSQLPLVPRALPGTGWYPGQHCEVCLAGSFLAFPRPVELGLSERFAAPLPVRDAAALFLVDLFPADFPVADFFTALFFDADFFAALFFDALFFAVAILSCLRSKLTPS